MNLKSTAQLFEILSFICLFAGVVLYIMAQSLQLNSVFLWLILIVALLFRILSLQFKNKALKEENNELRKDLKNLTHILEEKSE